MTDDTGEAAALGEPQYRDLAENAADVVYQVDATGRILWIAPSVTDILGWPPAQLLGAPAVDLFHPDDAATVQRERDDFYSGDGMVRTVRLITSDGRFRFMSVAARPLRAADGTVTGAVVGARDIDSVVRARHDAEADRQRLQATLDAQWDPHIILDAVRDADGRVVDFSYVAVNEAATRVLRWNRDELVGSRVLELSPGTADSWLFQQYVAVVDTGTPLVVDDLEFTPPGAPAIRLDIRGVKVGDGLSYTWRDVSARYAAASAVAESEQRYRLIAENASDVVLHVSDSIVRWVSPSLVETTGWSPDQWIGQRVQDAVHPDDHRILGEQRDLTASVGRSAYRVRMRFADGSYHWAEVHARRYIGADGQPDGTSASFRVIDREVEAERELERRARFDDLTGLLKRSEVLSRLDDIGSGRLTADRCGILFVDVDGFKGINDTLGHAAGDAVLVELAGRMSALVRDGDAIARMGGDEFLVILEDVDDLDSVLRVADTIRRAVSEPIETAWGTVRISASIGATLSRPVESGDAMIARADRAMYLAKASGRDAVADI